MIDDGGVPPLPPPIYKTDDKVERRQKEHARTDWMARYSHRDKCGNDKCEYFAAFDDGSTDDIHPSDPECWVFMYCCRRCWNVCEHNKKAKGYLHTDDCHKIWYSEEKVHEYVVQELEKASVTEAAAVACPRNLSDVEKSSVPGTMLPM